MGRSNLGFLSGPVTGHYRTCAITGLTTGLGAGATIFSAQFAPTKTSLRALVQRLRLQMAIVTSFTAAQEIYCSGYIARGWTGADSGGTLLTLSGSNAQLNSVADQASQMTMRSATTGAVTAGTRTLDAQPFIVCLGSQLYAASSTTTQSAPFSEEYVLDSDQQYPINLQGAAALAQNVPGTATGPEGIVVTNGIAMGAAGVVRWAVEIEWVEYDSLTSVGGSLA